MLKNLAATLLFALPTASLALAQDADASAELTTADTLTSEVAKKSMDLRQSMQTVQDARNAYSAGRYTDAVNLYKEALTLAPEAESTAKIRDFMKMSLADALIAKAIDYRKVGRTEEAISFLKEATEIAPTHKLAAHELEKTQDPIRQNPASSPQNVGNVAEVNRLLTLGYGAYDLGNYDEAIQHFTSILEIDRYNTAAQRGIETATNRKSAFYESAHDKVRAHALEEVDRAFVVGASSKSVEEALDLTDHGPINVATAEEVAASDYLATIPVENIAFDDASMTEVMDVLQGLLRRASTTNPAPNGQSINIVSNFGKVGTPAYEEAMKKTLRMSLSNITFRDLLDLITQQLGISYYYVPAGIEFSYSGKDFGPLIDRTFTVPPHFFATASDLEEEDAFGESSNSIKVNRVNPVEQLKGMGVSFPEGATARYLPSSRTLHVRNTAFNMELISEAMQYAPEGERLVVLNVYVISVNKDTLDELGFDVLLNLDMGADSILAGGTEQVISTVTGLPLVSTGDDDTSDSSPSATTASTAASVSSGLRSGGEVFTSNDMDRLINTGKVADFGGYAAEPSPGIFGFRGIWSALDLTVLMRGLNQKKGVDILQNPQLVFRPGMEEQVSIASVREMYYPESYEAPEISSASFYFQGQRTNSSIATAAHPDEFTYYGITEDQFAGVGTLLQVHSAEVTDGGRYVNLALSSTICEFEGFIDWGSPIYSGMITDGDAATAIELTDNKILKPIFKRSYENTAVTIAPGGVLVLGGMQESKKVTFADKIPIIGDLPLVGRLFRSEGEEDITKYLLFFAKVNIVDPSGMDTQTGMHPDANIMN